MNKLIPVKGGFVGEYECKAVGKEQDTSDMATIEIKGEKPVRYKIDFSKLTQVDNKEQQ